MDRLAILSTLLIALGCSEEKVDVTTGDGAATEEVVLAEFNAEGAPTVAFSVPNMMCEESCVPTVRKTLAAQPGVKDVQVDLATKTATVAVDEAAFDADKAVAALVDLQFTDAKLITQNEADAEEKSGANAKDAAPNGEKAAAETEAAKS